MGILVSKQIVKHYHPEELLHLWHPCRHELPDGISYLRIVSVVFEITVSFFRSFKYKHPDGIHAANHLQHTEEIALVLSNASMASLSSMISILPFFAQIYTFYPTFGRKSFVISKLLCIFAPKLRHEVVQIIVL